MVRHLSLIQIVIVLTILLFLSIVTGCTTRQENKVVVQRIDKYKIIHEVPKIYGNRIIWSDYRNNEDDIFMYDFNKKFESKLPVPKGSHTAQLNIYENTVVWSLGTWDAIMAYNIDTGSLTEIVTRTEPNDHKVRPSIYGDKVVWEDYRNGGSQVYMYDLNTKTETLISDIDNAPDQINNGGNPDIYENKIVWQGMSDETWWDVYMYDLGSDGIKDTNDDGGLTQITNTNGTQGEPKIYGNIIVWMDDRNDNWDIYMYDLLTKKETQITKDPCFQANPDIYGDIIAWNDSRNGCCNIYAYDIKNKQEIRITTKVSNQQHVAVYENMIAWSDYDNGGIYIATISEP